LVKKFFDKPQQTFSGNGSVKPEQTEIARLTLSVIKLKAERTSWKSPRPASQSEAPGDPGHGLAMRGAQPLAERPLCLADTAAQ
jgi:hypothetical protein